MTEPSSPPVDPTPSTPGVPPGWYHDSGAGRTRWWDGNAWSDPQPLTPPPSVPPPPSASPNGVGAVASVLGLVAFMGAILFGSRAGHFLTMLDILATAVALAAVVTGIVSIASNRGRVYGIVGLVVGALALIANAVI